MIELINANSIAIPLASQSVHLIVTSPPYFGLRAYGAGDGEIGAEPTPEEFIAALVAVGRECWRVLRDDGVMVVNLGDSYATHWGKSSAQFDGDISDGKNDPFTANKPASMRGGLQEGDRMNIPHRVASALQADGWLWRDTVIWRKKSAMPESVNGWRWERCRVKVKASRRGSGYHVEAYGDKPMSERDGREFADQSDRWQDCPGCDKCRDTDGLVLRRGSWRTTSAHEYIFVFAKGMGYFADREAVKKPAVKGAAGSTFTDGKTGVNGQGRVSQLPRQETGGANPRDVMTFKPTPFKGAHYATFPTTLPEFFIRAYTSEAGVCGECGAPWARVVDVKFVPRNPNNPNDVKGSVKAMADDGSNDWGGYGKGVTVSQTLGFRRTCEHAAPAVPATVLDPFNGSGSTLIAARQLGRSGIGLDLNLRYILDVARERLGLNAVKAWANGKAKGGETKVEDLPMFS